MDNYFLEINGVYEPPEPPVPDVIQSRHFLEINGVPPAEPQPVQSAPPAYQPGPHVAPTPGAIANADARIANEILAGRDADKLHLINPATGQEYTDREIAAIGDRLKDEQRAFLTPQFEETVGDLVEQGHPRGVAEQLAAFQFVQSGVPADVLPEGVSALDPGAVFTGQLEQFDLGRDISQGKEGREDQFVSIEDLDSIIENPDLFGADVVATAVLFRDAIDLPGNEEMREQFEKKGVWERIRDSEWLDPNSDSILVNLVRGGAGIPPSPAFLDRVVTAGPGELLEIGNSLNEIGRLANPLHIFVMAGHDVVTADDPMEALRALPGNQLDMYGNFGMGVFDWAKGMGELGVGAWALSNPMNAVALHEATGVNVYEEVGLAGEGLAWGLLEDPDQLANDLIGYDQFIENPHRWAGAEAADFVIDVLTGGAGAADDILGVAADARRLELPNGQGQLFDLQEFTTGQGQLFDDAIYRVDPEEILPVAPPANPDQLDLFNPPSRWPERTERPNEQLQWLDPAHERSWFISDDPTSFTHAGLPPGVRMGDDGTVRLPNADADALVTAPNLPSNEMRGAFGETLARFDLELRQHEIVWGGDTNLESRVARPGIDTISVAPNGSIYIFDEKYRSGAPVTAEYLSDTSYGRLLSDEWIQHHASNMNAARTLSDDLYARIQQGDYTPVLVRIGSDASPQYINLHNGVDMDTGEVIFPS